MKKEFIELEDALERAISNVLSEFEDSFVPESLAVIRKNHAPKCRGIKVTGGRASFCGCYTSEAVESVLELHRIWHEDLAVRINRLEEKDGLIDKRDVLFLISENMKWG